ncbi:MAG: FAD-linked oxidase [Roseateles depolymerans]|uniref:FAD-linked oxidase n=1 Tax=Roseateles depolymerans TaxID=76731 RepID=A0A2W5FJL5_9BURK|nr:MAG: FAD-linked oxidase [Roseateles depolymerans]
MPISPLIAAQQAWQQLLGPDRVHLEGYIPSHFTADTSGSFRDIPTVLKISEAAQIPEVLRIARAHGVPIHPVSTGNNWGYGSALPPTDGATVLDLSGLKEILHFDEQLGVATLEPGVTQGMLADYLDRHNLPYMVPTTGAGPSCSVLANALERGYGVTPYVDHFSAVTDLEAVLADGRIYKSALREAGGEDLARLSRWGIGPFSNGLFSQSGFGVVTRASILLAPRPECCKVCVFNLPSDDLLEEAVTRIQGLLSGLPGILGGINLMNRHRVLAMSAPYPPAEQRDARGLMPPALVAELGRQYQIGPWTGFATLYGRKRVVAAAQKEIRKALKGVAERLLFLSSTQARWLSTTATRLPGRLGERLGKTAGTLNSALELVQGRPNETALPLAYWRSGNSQPSHERDPARDRCGLLWYAPLVPMRSGDVRRFIEFATFELAKHGLEPLITLTSQGDRLFDSTIPLLFDLKDGDARLAAHECLARLTESGRSLGFYPYRLHLDGMRAHAERHPLSAHFVQRLRSALDPDDLLSPGRYV